MTHLGDRIAAFVDGQLPADERRLAEHHVESCEECRRKVREQRLLKSRMTSLGGVEAPEHLLASLSDVERLASVSDTSEQPGWLTRCLRSTSVRTVVAVTGASVTVTALAYGVGAPGSAAEPEVTPAVERFTNQFESSGPTVRAESSADVLAPAADAVSTAGPAPRSVDSSRELGADDEHAIGLLREAAGPSTYLDQLIRNFRIIGGETATIDGRSAVEVRAELGGRTVAAFWVDALTDEMLRRELYDDEGSVEDSVDYAPAPAPDSATTGGVGGRSVGGEGTQIASDTLDALSDSGWPCHQTLARDLARVRGHWVDVGNAHIVRLTYTDGLSRLSLYEQRGRLDASGLDGFERDRLDGSEVWIRDGDPRVAVWSAGGVVYTAVTDADLDRLRRVIAELPQDEADDGSLERVETGLRRMGSWAAPV